MLLEWFFLGEVIKNVGWYQLFFSLFCSVFTECDEWHARYLCTTSGFEKFPSNVASDGNKTQR